MTGSHSIFLKVCPACAAQVPTASDRCSCGHLFESGTAGALAPEEQTLRDEELYENYLLARAEQAREAARAAEDALMEDPESNDRASAAELAREVAKSIESDLAEQRAKVEALRRIVEAKRPKPAPPPAPAPVVVTPPTVPPAATPVIAAAIEPAAEIATPKHEAPLVKVTAPKPIKKPVPAPAATPVLASPAAATEKAAQVLNAIKAAKAREAAAETRKQRKAQPPKAVPPTPAPEPQIEVTLVPPAGFRQEQAARAEQVMETRKLVDTKDCPNCTASVPINTTRCSCGFAFLAGGSDLPSLTLCTGDFTALRNSLNLDLRRR